MKIYLSANRPAALETPSEESGGGSCGMSVMPLKPIPCISFMMTVTLAFNIYKINIFLLPEGIHIYEKTKEMGNMLKR